MDTHKTSIQEWVENDMKKIKYLSSVLPINYHKLHDHVVNNSPLPKFIFDEFSRMYTRLPKNFNADDELQNKVSKNDDNS
jgi:hypothetical protein